MLKVGAAKRSINPPPDMYPIYGMFDDIMAEEAYDDCACRAIAIENDSTKLLFLCYELAHPPVLNGFVGEIEKVTHIPADHIFISATHNHTSPGVEAPMLEHPTEYVVCIQKILHDRGLEACKAAVEALRPARCAYGTIPSYINTNRYRKTLCGYWVEARNLEGYSDKTLAILKFVDLDGKLIAAFLNHATHAVCACGQKDIDHKRKTSGNFTGIACNFVETHYGNGAVALWTSGAAGDQNPVLCHGLQYEYPDGYTTAMSYPDGTGFMQMEEMGRTHGADCVRGIDLLTEYSDDLKIQYFRKHVDLPARYRVEDGSVKNIFEERMGGVGPRPENIPYGTLAYPGKFPHMKEDPKRPAVLEMRLLMLNDIALIFVNAELLSLLGKAMKEKSPFENTVLVTQTGRNEIGYIFDKASADITVPMAFQCVVPGKSDELILACEESLFSMVDQER